MGKRKALSIVLLLAVLLAAALATEAPAASWVSLGTLPADQGFLPRPPAADGSGTLWALSVSDGAPNTAWVYRRPPGGAFTLFQILPAETFVSAVGTDGTIVAVSVGFSGVPCQAYVRHAGAAAFSPAVAIGTKCAPNDVHAVVHDGVAYVAYDEQSSGTIAHVAEVHPDGSVTDQAPTGQVSPSTVKDLAITPAGKSVLLLADAPDATHIRLATVDEDGGGGFGGALAVVRSRALGAGETTQAYGDAVVRQDVLGDRLALWIVSVDGTRQITVRVRPAGASAYDPSQLLDSGEYNILLPSLALGANGDATAAWVSDPSSTAPAVALVAGATRAGGYAFPSAGTNATPGGDVHRATLTALAGGGLAGAVELTGGSVVPLSTAPASIGSPFASGSMTPASADGLGDAFLGVSSGTSMNTVAAYDATPPVPGTIATPAAPVAGAAATLSLPATDALSGVTAVAWDFGDGTTGSGAGVTHTWPAAGTYTVQATATDGAGNAAAASPVSVNVAAPTGSSSPPASPPAPPPAAPDTLAPVLSGLKLSHTRFAVSAAATAVSARAATKAAPKGTTITVRVTEAATVTLTFTRHAAGRRSGKACVATTRPVPKAKRCTATVRDGRLTRAAKAGVLTVRFSGRIGRKALATGPHTLTVTATDAAGNHATARTAHLTITAR